jgi:hypothetical protein
MAHDFPMNDPRKIWQDQTTEACKMSAQDLGCKAQQHQSKARFEAGYSIISGFVLCGLFALAFAHAHEMVPRLGWGLLRLGSGYFA